jgi:hypothetical protein
MTNEVGQRRAMEEEVHVNRRDRSCEGNDHRRAYASGLVLTAAVTDDCFDK